MNALKTYRIDLKPHNQKFYKSDQLSFADNFIPRATLKNNDDSQNDSKFSGLEGLSYNEGEQPPEALRNDTEDFPETEDGERYWKSVLDIPIRPLVGDQKERPLREYADGKAKAYLLVNVATNDETAKPHYRMLQ